MTSRKKITADHWWGALSSQVMVIRDTINRAVMASRRDTGHDCGHVFRIECEVRGHNTEAMPHYDDPSFAPLLMTIEVRATDLQNALLRAATISLSEWDFSYPDKSELT